MIGNMYNSISSGFGILGSSASTGASVFNDFNNFRTQIGLPSFAGDVANSYMRPYGYGVSGTQVANDPGYAMDPGVAYNTFTNRMDALASAPGSIFGKTLEASLVLQTIPRTLRYLAGERGVGPLTPIGLRSALFGQTALSNAAARVTRSMSATGIGRFAMGAVGGGLFGGGPVGALIGGIGAAWKGKPIGYKTAARSTGGVLGGLFGLRDPGIAGAKVDTTLPRGGTVTSPGVAPTAAYKPPSPISGKTYFSGRVGAEVYSNISSREMSQQKRNIVKQTSTAHGRIYDERQYFDEMVGAKVSVRENPRLINSIASRNLTPSEVGDPLYHMKKGGYSDVFRLGPGGKKERIKSYVQFTDDIYNRVESTYSDLERGFDATKSTFNKQLGDIFKSAVGRSMFTNARSLLGASLGFGGLNFQTMGYLTSLVKGRPSIESQVDSIEKKIREKMDKKIDKAIKKTNREIRSKNKALNDYLDEFTVFAETGSKGRFNTVNNVSKLEIDRSRIRTAGQIDRSAINLNIDRDAIRNTLPSERVKGAKVLGNLIRYHYVWNQISQYAGDAVGRGLQSVKETAALARNIGRMEFGTGRTLDTQVASTERSRAIQAMQNVGISARSYLGQEAAIQAQGY